MWLRVVAGMWLRVVTGIGLRVVTGMWLRAVTDMWFRGVKGIELRVVTERGQLEMWLRVATGMRLRVVTETWCQCQLSQSDFGERSELQRLKAWRDLPMVCRSMRGVLELVFCPTVKMRMSGYWLASLR